MFSPPGGSFNAMVNQYYYYFIIISLKIKNENNLNKTRKLNTVNS